MKPLRPIVESGRVPIGPLGNQWFYSPETKSYDLTRGDTQSLPFSFSTSEGTSNVTVVVAPELTTLVVIDMQNYFLHPSCNDHSSGRVAAQKTVEIVKKCREVGIKVSGEGSHDAKLMCMMETINPTRQVLRSFGSIGA